MSEKHAIIVAGGTGARMGGSKPKQFLEIDGRPILMHTLELFAHSVSPIHIVLVLPENHIVLWEELCTQHDFSIPYRLVTGGATRFQSVKNGLFILPDNGLVAVHDGVRPFAAASVIQQSFAVAAEKGNAVTSLPLKETIRELTGGSSANSVSRDRTKFRLVQTPQTFRISLLKKAYEQTESSIFTDDASVVEQIGEKINLIEGNEENIKITHSADLTFANALYENKKSPT